MCYTPLGKTPFHMWRSIWNSMKLLQEGLLWWVGDGRTVKIWNGRWVALPVTYSIQSPVQILDQEAKVCALIDEDTN
jgi:hypothetical protein